MVVKISNLDNHLPTPLATDQMNCRMSIAHELLNDVNNPDFLKRVITDGDEAWVYGYDIETLNHPNGSGQKG